MLVPRRIYVVVEVIARGIEVAGKAIEAIKVIKVGRVVDDIFIHYFITIYSVRARRGFGEDLKEQYKFYLNLRVYSS